MASPAPLSASDAELLKGFDSLPDSATVRVPVVAALVGISVNTAWRWAKDGRLPKPHKIGPNTTAWKVGELRQKRAVVSA